MLYTPVILTPEEPRALPFSAITKLAFRNRFTFAEKTAIELAALDIPAGTTEERQKAAMIRVMLKDTESASFIDLARPDTRAGVLFLETEGVLGAGRALEILDTPITAAEQPLT